MKKYLIAFVIAAALLAAEDVLAHKCRSVLWGGVLPALVLAGSIAVFALGAVPATPHFLLPFAALNAALLWSWSSGREKRRREVNGSTGPAPEGNGQA